MKKYNLKLRTGVIITGLLIGGSICLSSLVNAEEVKVDPRRTIHISKQHTSTSRPKAPSMQQIECVYADGSLSFEFAVPEGYCILTLTDNISGQVISADFNSDAPASVYVGYHESANISIISAQGNTYTGTW